MAVGAKGIEQKGSLSPSGSTTACLLGGPGGQDTAGEVPTAQELPCPDEGGGRGAACPDSFY